MPYCSLLALLDLVINCWLYWWRRDAVTAVNGVLFLWNFYFIYFGVTNIVKEVRNRLVNCLGYKASNTSPHRPSLLVRDQILADP